MSTCQSALDIKLSLRNVDIHKLVDEQIEKAKEQGYRMKTGVECEFFLLTNNEETEVADSKDVAPKPCYEQVIKTHPYSLH